MISDFRVPALSIETHNVGFDMGEKKPNSKTQGVCYEENSNVV